MRSNIIPTTANSGTTPILGRWLPLTRSDRLSLQLQTDGSVAGTWKVLASDKPDVDVAGDDNPSDITGMFSVPSTIAGAPAGGSSQYVQADGPVWAGAINVQFTPTSGSGHARADVNQAEPRVQLV
jgi:hypothetical protein